MPYALLDDQFHSNQKVIAMGLDGTGLYSRALSYCANYLTDGFVPYEWVAGVAARKKRLLAHLETVGAWQRVHVRDQIRYTDRTGNELDLDVEVEGFWIADYTMFNPSRIEYEAMRKRKSKAGRKGAITRWGDSSSDSTTHSSTNGNSHGDDGTSDGDKHGDDVTPAIAPAKADATPHARAQARTPSPKELTKAVDVPSYAPDPEPPPPDEPDVPTAQDQEYLQKITPELRSLT